MLAGSEGGEEGNGKEEKERRRESLEGKGEGEGVEGGPANSAEVILFGLMVHLRPCSLPRQSALRRVAGCRVQYVGRAGKVAGSVWKEGTGGKW